MNEHIRSQSEERMRLSYEAVFVKVGEAGGCQAASRSSSAGG